MSQSLSNIQLHVVFSTKGRQPWLRDVNVRRELHAYMAGVLRAMNCPAIAVNGTGDHIHVLCQLSRTVSTAALLEEMKKRPSKWIKEKGPPYSEFQWQAGYGVFAVSQSLVPKVRAYIARQEEHHQRVSFQDEFRVLCGKNQVQLDERYAWD